MKFQPLLNLILNEVNKEIFLIFMNFGRRETEKNEKNVPEILSMKNSRNFFQILTIKADFHVETLQEYRITEFEGDVYEII